MDAADVTLKVQQEKPLRLFYRIRANLGWSVFSEFGGKGFLFLVGVYLARKLEVENYGLLSYAQTVVSYFWLAVDLGVNMYGPREIARNKGEINNIISVLLTIRMVSGIFIFIMYLAGIYYLISSPLQRLIFFCCAFYLVARSINTDWAFRGLEKFKYLAVGNFVTFFSMLLLTFIFIKGKGDVITAALIWALSYFLGGVVLWTILHRILNVSYRPIFHMPSWTMHLRESLHFTVSGGLLTLYQSLPIVYLGVFALAYDIGLFSAPYGLVSAIMYAISIVPISLYPILSELYVRDKTKFAKLRRHYQLAAFFMGMAVLFMGNVFAVPIIKMVYSMKYAESVPYFRILLIYIFFFCVRSPFGIAIAAAGLQRFYTFASAAAVLFYSGVFFVARFAMHLSFPGAASIALAATEFCLCLMLISIWRVKGGYA